jgi:hypothetical protein
LFRIRLVLERTEDRMVFRVGRLFRVVNVVTALVLVAAGFLLQSATVPAVLASLALLGALYQESSTFDKSRGRAEFRLGLLVFHRTKAFDLADVVEVRTSTFGSARFIGLEVGLRDGSTLTIENDRGKASFERLSSWGAELAQWLGVPLVT